MTNGLVRAVYENGVFRPLEQPSNLAEHQHVRLYIITDDIGGPEPELLEEKLRFVRETMGIWHVADEEFRRWLAEEVNLFSDEGKLI